MPLLPPVPYSVVVVDDTYELRCLWKLILDRDERFAVVADAANGQTGAAAAALHQPDLVLLDIAMPVMDGIEALALIRRQSPHSTVVMHSSFSQDSAQAELARRMGAHGFIRNGLRRQALLGKLEAILRHRAGAAATSAQFEAVE
jgi:DNA-binding NarL/FixJ family response regulator